MRTKKALLNTLTDIIPLIIISIIGIFKLKLFIQILGQETLGLYQLFSQIMIYIGIVDGGLSTAALYVLYKPNTENDLNKMNSILSATKKVYSIIAIIIFGIALIASTFMPLIIKDNTFPYWYVTLTFLLFAVGAVIDYFFVSYKNLYEVKEKKYIANIIIQSGQIIIGILEIILLLTGFSFITVLIMHAIIKIIADIILATICRHKFNQYQFNKKEKDYTFTKQLKHLIVHKVNALIGSNIDIILITTILGLKAVAIYSTYNYIINMLRIIIDKFIASINAIIGNIMAESRAQALRLFKELDSLMFYIGTIICVPLLFAINDFIRIWYNNNIMTTSLIATAFIAVLFSYIIRTPIIIFINTNGLFKETKICSVVDMTINFTLSIILIHYMGIPGVLIATAISMFIAEYIMKTIIVYKRVFEDSCRKRFMNDIKFFIFFLGDITISYFIMKNIVINNIWAWLITYLIFTLTNSIIIYLLYYFSHETDFVKRFKKLLVKE